jgi:hypothetical protein
MAMGWHGVVIGTLIGIGGTEILFIARDISDQPRKDSNDLDTYAILTDVNEAL